MGSKPIYLKGLNGIRAIASIAVVISHITLSLELFGLDSHIFGTNDKGDPKSYELAGYGVSMFFALSGFLITYLLLLEKEKKKISIKKFYFRRILRIWPLYYAYMIGCFVVYYFFNLSENLSSTYYYLFYAANIPFILGKELLFLGHFWSLAVEEQFYMFWPWLSKLKLSFLKKITLLLIVVLISTKLILHFLVSDSIAELAIHVTRFHCMLMGCYAAILFYEKNELFRQFITHQYTQLAAWICFGLVAINRFHIASVIDNEILSGITIMIIMGQITGKGLISLERKGLDFLGKISYGVYVIHPLLIFLFSKFLFVSTGYTWLNYSIVYGSIISATILLAFISFRYFESLFLKLKKKKYTVIESSSGMKSAE